MKTWPAFLDHTIDRFGGQTPGPTLQATVERAYAEHPHLVQATVERIAIRHANGTASSPWGILKADLERRTQATPAASAQADQAKALTRAEQRMRAEFLHYDRWSEVADELFRDNAPLHAWPHLEQQLHDLYDELRPAGELIEQQAIDRQAKYAQDATDMAAAAKRKKHQLDQKQAEPKAAA